MGDQASRAEERSSLTSVRSATRDTRWLPPALAATTAPKLGVVEPDAPAQLPKSEPRTAPTQAKSRAVPILASALRRARLRLTQTRPVISRLGLGGKQCAQLTLLLGDKHTDNLPAYLRHAHPTHSRNTVQPDQH